MSRTLVKSAPELWAEVSDPGTLARHLGEFGEIRITRVEQESSVAWEADSASGTVELEPAGWGTRVRVTARTGPKDAAPEVPAEAPPAPSTPEPAPPTRRPSWWARRLRRSTPPAPVATRLEPPVAEEPVSDAAARGAMAVLFAMLDTLGSAQHRPFSRD